MTSSVGAFAGVRVAIRGGGDLASGAAYRLARCGFPVLIAELARPLLLRRAVSFGSAVVESTITVEGITASRAATLEAALAAQSRGQIPVVIDPAAHIVAAYQPTVLVDARMLKRPAGPRSGVALVEIGLGPGFTAPDNCDAVIETNRGHRMGRVITKGAAEADTGTPEGVMGHRSDRVLRAPAHGHIAGIAAIGTRLEEGDPIASVGEQYLVAPFNGVLRGLIHDGIEVNAGDKVGDLDPRGDPQACFTLSDKALAVGGGVLEAILAHPAIQERISRIGEAG